MTRKQMKRVAEELTNLELIHQNPNSSKEEKVRAERRIMSITNQLMSTKEGLAVMGEIDSMIQNNLKKHKEN